ncbi:chorismate-binding protein [Lysinibacillus odysseyi]|uniref:chorismate-binding protein n=1 Tax=Lysinibacillus odysseyi TaxID=202611 RepID=UPI00068CE3FC|nr:chorismate-binding protein [Lysinibacillus odysseyi]
MIKHKLRTTIKKINGDCLTPVLIFNRLQGKRKFLLESSAKHETTGRYSFIGANPRKTYTGSNKTLTEYSYLTDRSYSYEGDLVNLLKQVMPRISTNTEYPFTGGAIGYIRFNREQADIPAINFHVYDTIVIFDHVTDEVTIIHTNIEAEVKEPCIEEVMHQIINADTLLPQEFLLGRFTEQTSKKEWTGQVEQLQKMIAAGELTEVVLSRRLLADFSGDAFSLYRALRVKHPSPYLYYIEFDDHTVIGASPTSVVGVHGHVLKTNASTNIQDVCLRDTIQQKDDVISGVLSPALHAIDALTYLLPADIVTGKQKQQAEEAIQKTEQSQRALYGGAIGYIGFNGQIDFALASRTLILQQGKALTETGATVTAESVGSILYEHSQVDLLSEMVKGRTS